ncbi:hypothetical protein TREMEDRAFT_63541 [Tremella mesenterica DSM 1558]|uniref:uncharacterized protein n=1 Tax=Tremella mesenterica (strain ATCC 24925 / CBS 8224 / DSM 1558 / NBRC 9311 / NRRL Y-6157 / RJB 2259-6 / UBC 559-6) TaxID=578456 RepID=UPI0003F49A2F|nr:uncharacterized protein TREMEDRAFT_63541 [Tremella mesenterica DSM 1558]EIW68373.1 hypothetical protein TREMEDRAFT_63541 [Tremella mesenterica DSM 1558]
MSHLDVHQLIACLEGLSTKPDEFDQLISHGILPSEITEGWKTEWPEAYDAWMVIRTKNPFHNPLHYALAHGRPPGSHSELMECAMQVDSLETAQKALTRLAELEERKSYQRSEMIDSKTSSPSSHEEDMVRCDPTSIVELGLGRWKVLSEDQTMHCDVDEMGDTRVSVSERGGKRLLSVINQEKEVQYREYHEDGDGDGDEFNGTRYTWNNIPGVINVNLEQSGEVTFYYSINEGLETMTVRAEEYRRPELGPTERGPSWSLYDVDEEASEGRARLYQVTIDAEEGEAPFSYHAQNGRKALRAVGDKTSSAIVVKNFEGEIMWSHPRYETIIESENKFGSGWWPGDADIRESLDAMLEMSDEVDKGSPEVSDQEVHVDIPFPFVPEEDDRLPPEEVIPLDYNHSLLVPPSIPLSSHSSRESSTERPCG